MSDVNVIPRSCLRPLIRNMLPYSRAQSILSPRYRISVMGEIDAHGLITSAPLYLHFIHFANGLFLLQFTIDANYSQLFTR